MRKFHFDSITAFSIDRKPEKWTRRKYPIIYGQWGSVQAPLAYITKPRWLDDKEFRKFIDALTLSINTPPPGKKK